MIVVVVVGALWWTKTIAFTKTAVVVFGTKQPADGSASFTLIDVEAAPDDLTKTAELLAQTHGGSSSDYESDLTITSATDVSGLAATAQDCTPDAAQSLATDAAGLLSSYLSRRSTPPTQPLHLHRRPCAAIISHPSKGNHSGQACSFNRAERPRGDCFGGTIQTSRRECSANHRAAVERRSQSMWKHNSGSGNP